ncbi:MAG: translation initiation factor IF-2 [Bacteroidota bacterium]|nr:translation initiation factor IF-2 [Bacteroidota bacterium]
MTEKKELRLSKLAREFNVGITTIVDFLKKKGHDIESNPNTKVAPELYNLLSKEYSSDINAKKESEKVNLRSLREKKESVSLDEFEPEVSENEEEEIEETKILIKDTSTGKKAPLIFEPKREVKEPEVKIVGKIDIENASKPSKPEPKPEPIPTPEPVRPEEEKPEVQVIPEPVIEAPKPPVVEEPKKEEMAQKTEPVVEKTEETFIVEPVIKITEPAAEEAPVEEEPLTTKPEVENEIKVVGRIDLNSLNQRTRPPKKTKEQRNEERKERQQQSRNIEPKTETSENETESQQKSGPEVIRAEVKKLSGPTVVGRIDLPSDDRKKPVASSDEHDHRKKRKRIKKEKEKVNIAEKPKPAEGGTGTPARKPEFIKRDKDKDKDKAKPKNVRRPLLRTEVSEEDVQKQIKDTLARLTSKGNKSKTSKYRREKRDIYTQRMQEEMEQQEREKNILKVTEFVSVNELASMMDVPVTEVIATCMNMGLFVSINQRLDAETMALVADEFDYKVEFVSIELQDALKQEEVVDQPEDMESRPPIVAVMGHVDHGKTKLLDFIRSANVVAGEAGGITQHIGAYTVRDAKGRQITFLDTPGHEAFTAMRARGAKITDVAIIVVAADDGVKPQTKEAINHASAAGVPIVFAINKVDKKEANPEKIKEELAQMNYLVEDWGGKYQSQEISAKNGLNIDLLLDKVLLEAELLELKANPNKKASGTVIESTLDKGRGYVATILVEQGTLRNGDIVLAGNYFGHVKAMYNERNQRITEAGPATPVLLLGLDGAPQAGDTFNVMNDVKEAKDIATKRSQLIREQGIRTKKHITLDEIGRRIAIGNFQELNVIVKGDVDGSVEALSDSLIKLSTPEIQVNVIHKAVGQISESDILLAAASNAIIVGFQVRPSVNARKLAEKEQIDIRLYSIIYDAIEEIKAAMEGMLSPEIKEEIVATIEIRDVFKITKVGTVAGCFVREGKITRNTKVRIIRDGIVIYSGELGSLKRFKDDVKEVASGYECGLNIHNFNDIQMGDVIEGYQETEVKKKL